MREYRRTLISVLLATLAVAGPCLAWYVVGSRHVEREAARLLGEPRRAGRRAAQQVALRLGVRLEALRETEAGRPWSHYRHRYHDISSGCACAAVRDSPLVQGSRDPLVETFFQLDAAGGLLLPALDADAGVEKAWTDDQRLLRADLQAAAPALLAAATGSPGPDGRASLRPSSGDVVAPASYDVPAELTTGEDVLLFAGAFRWHTVPMSCGPTLVAMRDVVTTSEELVQGFVVSGDALADSVSGGPLATRIRPGPASQAGDVELPVPDVEWSVRVDTQATGAAAVEQARLLRRQFVRRFAGGTLAAALAAFSLVGMVFQSERLARQRSRFAALAAHELRTPLASLRLHGEMLADGLGHPERTGGYARRVVDEAERLGRVVTNILGTTRLEESRHAVTPSPGDLADVVRRCVADLRAGVVASGATLVLEVANDLPEVSFDADAVCQILQNLVDNAEKYARTGSDRAILVSLQCVPDGVALAVGDRGRGVPDRLSRRIFRPFVRGDSGDDPAGLGLGLALVDSLARAHGGCVRHRTRPGGGSIFTVTLPA